MEAVTLQLPAEVDAYAPDAAVYQAMVDLHGAPEWFDDLDLRPAPPYHRVGTRTATVDDWLLADAARPMELALRGRLLDERRDLVVACDPAAENAAHATLALVLDWLADQGIEHTPPDPDEHPLVAAGRLVQDDLCLMVHRDGDWHLDGGVLCFATLWQLRDRLGKPTRDVHEHVAHYDEVGSRVDTFFDRMPPGRIVWRRNFSFKLSPHLHLPMTNTPTPTGEVVIARDGSPLWLRSERQTLRRLAGSDAIVFAIRVQQTPARALLRRPDIAAGLAANIAEWDRPLRDYKLADDRLYDAILAWLRQVGE